MDEWVEVTVEVPGGSRNKYERSRDGDLRLDRVLFSSVHYPADYGIVEGTRGEDGEPLDALVLISQPTFPGCHVPARVVGVLDTRDRRGVDHKLLCVAAGDPHFDGVEDIGDVGPHWLRQIEHFFATYKDLEVDETEVVGWEGAEAAERILEAARDLSSEVLP